MKDEYKTINELLERFFEGLTSVNEERELYRFFKQSAIPEEFVRYKPVMHYFEDGIIKEMDKPAHLSFKRRWLMWGSVAASFLLILFASLFYFQKEESADPFEGSYIIRNGVRITDLNLIRPVLEATIQQALLQEQETDRFIEQLMKPDFSVEIQIIQQTHDHYQRILDNIQHEEIRNEVATILYTNF